jgi:type II secretory pathway component PulF
MTLDELVLLTEEFRALVRAGVPLDVGFRTSGPRLPGRLHRLATALSEELERGSTLDQALKNQGDIAPPAYRMLVTVGARTGRLDELLKRMAEFGEAMRAMQQSLRDALLYPTAVLIVGYVLFIGMLLTLVPQSIAFFIDLRTPPPFWLVWGDWLRSTLPIWGPAIPVILILLAAWTRLTARASSWQPVPDVGGIGRWIPGMARAIRETEYSRFAQLLSLLADARIPLPEALPLAAAAISDPRLIRWADEEAARVQSGRPASALGSSPVPAILQWYIAHGERDGDLSGSLQQMAKLYRERALMRMARLVAVWPVVLTLGLGLLFIGLYATTTFGTLVTLWEKIPT